MNMNVEIDSRTAVVVGVLLLAVAGFFSYRWWSDQESYVDRRALERAGRMAVEKPVREQLLAEGVKEPEIEARLAGMWKSGELKMPAGKAGVDWWVDISGNIMLLPKPEDLMRGGGPPPPPQGPGVLEPDAP